MIMRPEDIKNRTFAHALRGYDKDEVRSFLFRVAESSQELHDQLTATEEQLAAASAAALTADAEADAGEADEGSAHVEAEIEREGERGVEPVTADSEMSDLAATERSIADRYGALGDRIAELLRSADESAAVILAGAENESEEMRAAAAAEAAQVRSDAEMHASELLAEARAIREEADAHRAQVTSELETARTEQETALAEAKAAAEAEVEAFRVDSIEEIEALRAEARTEVDELRMSVEAEVETLRESAIADGQAATAEHEAEAARLRQEAEIDRQAARTELDDVRAEVSGLLEQARTQSEFIKQEADEIIRTKVRANFEQAQARLDVLRNTEVASRERIVRAQTELTSALNRLDSEPAPELDPAAAPEIIEQAERRHDELNTGVSFDDEVGRRDGDDLVEADVIEASEVDDGETGDRAADAEWGGQAAFEADIAEANQQIQAETDQNSPLSAFFGPGPQDDTTDRDDILDTAAGFVESETVEEAVSGSEHGDGPFGGDAADVTEHVVVEATTGEETDAAEAADDTEGEHGQDDEPAPTGFAATLGEALPQPGTDMGGQAEEDALARLVREAMQEAVDSARKND